MSSSPRKRILICLDWFAPGYKAGGPIRSSVNFAYAMRSTYDIYVITGDRDFGETKAYEDIQTNTWTQFDEDIQVFYASPDQITLGFWKQKFGEIDPDFIYLNNFFSPGFTFYPLWANSAVRKESKWIIAPRGMLHKGALQFKKLKKNIYIIGLKVLGLVKHVHFQATDEQEKVDIQSHLNPPKPISIISNLPYSKQEERQHRIKEAGSFEAIFFSRISPKKNLDYFLRLLEDFEAHIQIKLDIIGPIEDSEYWKSCQEIAARLTSTVSMNYLGVFPHEEVMKRLKKYHLFILPTHGENFGHAIFESFLAGCPVLISDQTPWRNLTEKKIGWDIPLSDKNAYIAAIDAVAAMDQKTWDTWSIASWEFSKHYLQHSHTKEKYHTLFQ